jgi:hypothetical protein
MKLTTSTQVSVDGVMQASGERNENLDPRNGARRIHQRTPAGSISRVSADVRSGTLYEHRLLAMPTWFWRKWGRLIDEVTRGAAAGRGSSRGRPASERHNASPSVVGDV